MEKMEIEQRSDAMLLPAGIWAVDPDQSEVGFSIRHLMVSTVRGRFTEFEGMLWCDGSRAFAGTGSVGAASIDTGEPVRDERLRGQEFFDVGRWPKIEFACSSIKPVEAGAFKAIGELEIKGARDEVELCVEPLTLATDAALLKLRGELGRTTFGLASAALLEAGVSDRVKLWLDLSLSRIGSHPQGRL